MKLVKELVAWSELLRGLFTSGAIIVMLGGILYVARKFTEE